MSDKTDQNQAKPSEPPTAKPVLRIVASEQPEKPEKRPGENNTFVKFMNAYADAIDDEIRAIMRL